MTSNEPTHRVNEWEMFDATTGEVRDCTVEELFETSALIDGTQPADPPYTPGEDPGHYTVVTITPKGQVSVESFIGAPADPYDILRTRIGCDVVAYGAMPGRDLTVWFNHERGREDSNPVASIVAAKLGDLRVYGSGPDGPVDVGIAGTCVFTGGPDAVGETLGLSVEAASLVMRAAAEAACILRHPSGGGV